MFSDFCDRTLLVLTLCLGVLFSPTMSRADNWIYFEFRQIPPGCIDPISCVGNSSVLVRNMMRASNGEQERLLNVLNAAATIRGIEDDLVAESILQAGSSVLHDISIADKLRPLINHPGVYFDAAKLESDEETAEFGQFVRIKLSEAGIPILTKDQWEKTPGRPVLSVRYSARRESEGCIIPYSISLSIKEEVVLARDPSQKLTTTIWSGTSRQNLANLNFTPTSALREAVKKLTSDYKRANNV